MLLLFETAAGLALFKVLKEDKLKEAEASAAGTPRRIARPPRPALWRSLLSLT
jgi:hypothetical protein